jgi:hypothetical protein
MAQNNREHRERLRKAYMELAEQMQPNAFVSLATNSHGSVSEMTRLIGIFCGMLDRALLGQKWPTFPVEQRTDGIFVIEHTKTNIHAHGLLRFADPEKTDLALLTTRKWYRLSEAGTVDFQRIYDVEGCAAYCTKEMRSFLFDPDQVVLARQFMAN